MNQLALAITVGTDDYACWRTDEYVLGRHLEWLVGRHNRRQNHHWWREGG